MSHPNETLASTYDLGLVVLMSVIAIISFYIGIRYNLVLGLSAAVASATAFVTSSLAFRLRDSTAALHDSERCCQTLIDKMPIGVVFLAPSLEIISSNQTAIDQLGLTQSELLGQSIFNGNVPVLREDGTPFTPESLPMQQALATKEPVCNIVLGVSDSLKAELRWFLVNAEPHLAADGKVEHLICTFNDITALKQVETALQQSQAREQEKAMQLEQTVKEYKQVQAKLIQAEKMSSLGHLVAGVAHEINNPVSCIYGNLTHANRYIYDLLDLVHLYQQHYPNPVHDIQSRSEAIDLDFLREDLPKLMNSLKVGAERIFQLVLSLKHFSHHDQAMMRRVDIHTGIDSTLLILQTQLKASGRNRAIKVVKEYGDLPLVECYAGQLNQVFMNILSNAIDALEDARSKPSEISPCIWIRTSYSYSHYPKARTTTTEEPIADSVLIQISDNGPGMTQTVKSHLFDPFFTTKPVGKGTGLGLSISHQIVVEKLGGLLWCESEQGKGTQFWIKIPVRPNCQKSAERKVLDEATVQSAIEMMNDRVQAECRPVELQLNSSTPSEAIARSATPEAVAEFFKNA
jgi:PAS domain S-box-containing protein